MIQAAFARTASPKRGEGFRADEGADAEPEADSGEANRHPCSATRATSARRVRSHRATRCPSARSTAVCPARPAHAAARTDDQLDDERASPPSPPSAIQRSRERTTRADANTSHAHLHRKPPPGFEPTLEPSKKSEEEGFDRVFESVESVVVEAGGDHDHAWRFRKPGRHSRSIASAAVFAAARTARQDGDARRGVGASGRARLPARSIARAAHASDGAARGKSEGWASE